MRTHDLDETLEQLELDLGHYIVDRAPQRTFVHAGVVGWNGQAIVIPGRSFKGKSSLVKALTQAVAQASVLGATRGEAAETARHILGGDLLRREPSAPLGQGGEHGICGTSSTHEPARDA